MNPVMERMNPNVQLGLAFGAGACAGAVPAMLVCRRIFGRKAEARITYEVDQIKDHYRERIQQLREAHAASLANAVGKGDNPIDGPTSMGRDERWIRPNDPGLAAKRDGASSEGGDELGGSEGSRSDPDGGERSTAEPASSERGTTGRVESEGRVGPGERSLSRLYGETDDLDESELPGWAAGVVPENDREPGSSSENGSVDGSPDDDSTTTDDQSSREVPASSVLDGTHPRVITAGEFDDVDEHSKICLTWFEGDRVLADDHGRPIRAYADVVGLQFIHEFHKEENNPHVVYVVSPKLSSAFEIVLDERSWQEAHLNYGNPL